MRQSIKSTFIEHLSHMPIIPVATTNDNVQLWKAQLITSHIICGM